MPRRLIIRLSSIGDIILAASTLDALTGADWLVASEFAELLRGHPKIGRVWAFDRKAGLRGWWQLCTKLHSESYDEVVDLHQTLRSRVAWLCFLILNSRDTKRSALKAARWKTCRKPRFRTWGYFVFKGLWPRAWRPGLHIHRYADFLGADHLRSRPDFRHLVEGQPWPQQLPVLRQPYYCVMPGSQWKGKRWPVRNFGSLVGLLGVPVVVMGSAKDQESAELVKQLKQKGLPFVDAVGKLSLRECAVVLSQSAAYVGNDTGLGHLAESVGVRAHMILGPTVADQGFGPWRQESTVSGADLWCRPCGKDGRACFRFTHRYKCMLALSPAQVARTIGTAHGK